MGENSALTDDRASSETLIAPSELLETSPKKSTFDVFESDEADQTTGDDDVEGLGVHHDHGMK